MGLPEQVAKFSAAEYLSWENAQATKHEFLAGEVFAMVGTTDGHNTVAGNLYAIIKTHLRGGPCRVYISDMKVRVEAADAYFYPDVLVTCDARDHADQGEKKHPKLVIEVLSPSTGDYDRGEKFAMYRKIAELQEYVLIDPELRTADVFRRVDTNQWRLWDTRGLSELRLESIELSVAFEDVFENVPARR
jgi:Uma2 family endonuclease